MTFIKGIASLGGTILIGLSAPSAQAGYVVDLTQQGGNVVATGSGAIDMTGLTFLNGYIGISSLIRSIFGTILTGAGPEGYYYSGIVAGPDNFGSGQTVFASSDSGDEVGIFFGTILVPPGYVSDSPLSDTATYDSQTFNSLRVTPGTYQWTWGTGANQNFTLVIGAVVPEPSTWAMMLIGFAGLGFMGYRSAGWRRTAGNA
jgi:PEP-CTERM motif